MSALTDAVTAQQEALKTFIADVEAALQRIAAAASGNAEVAAEVAALTASTQAVKDESTKVETALNPPA